MTSDVQYFVRKITQNREWLNYNRQDYRPFQIKFVLGAPIALTVPWVNFDGLLGHLMLLHSLGRDYFLLPAKLNIRPYLRGHARYVPLKRTGKVTHASVSILEPNVAKLTTLYKRFEADTTRLGRYRTRKIRLGSGYYRLHALQTPYVAAKTVTFYVNGVFDLIRDLIKSHVFALGNEIRVGFGVVRNVEFTLLSEDWSLVKDGKAMRPIPVEMCEEYEMATMLAYKAPYWHPDSVELCVPPGAKCKLKKCYET